MHPEHEEELVVDEIELVNYIFGRLLEEGIVVTQDDISKILNYEMEYLVEQGIAVFSEEE